VSIVGDSSAHAAPQKAKDKVASERQQLRLHVAEYETRDIGNLLWSGTDGVLRIWKTALT
jgi:hypothetical protein